MCRRPGQSPTHERRDRGHTGPGAGSEGSGESGADVSPSRSPWQPACLPGGPGGGQHGVRVARGPRPCALRTPGRGGCGVAPPPAVAPGVAPGSGRRVFRQLGSRRWPPALPRRGPGSALVHAGFALQPTDSGVLARGRRRPPRWGDVAAYARRRESRDRGTPQRTARLVVARRSPPPPGRSARGPVSPQGTEGADVPGTPVLGLGFRNRGREGPHHARAGPLVLTPSRGEGTPTSLRCVAPVRPPPRRHPLQNRAREDRSDPVGSGVLGARVAGLASARPHCHTAAEKTPRPQECLWVVCLYYASFGFNLPRASGGRAAGR